jgi:hypothetical protein
MLGNSGSQLISADGVVGVSGKPIRIFNIHIISGAGGAAVVNLRSGAAVGGTIRIKETGIIDTGKTFSYGKRGFLFEAGCYCDVDTNTTSVLVQYVQEK